jgi:PAS domain S-box-containing protein
MYAAVAKPLGYITMGALRRHEHPDKLHILQLFVEQAVDFAVFLLDSDGRVVTWNLGAERLLGYEAEEVVGGHFSRFFTLEDRADGIPQRELETAATTGRAADDRWTVQKAGGRVWVSGVTTAVRHPELIGFVKVMRDSTITKLAEDEIRKLNQELMKKVKELDASRQELYEKVLELETFQQVVVGRELRMVELEREIEALRRRLGHGASEARSA